MSHTSGTQTAAKKLAAIVDSRELLFVAIHEKVLPNGTLSSSKSS
jgi:hypothetical protein